MWNGRVGAMRAGALLLGVALLLLALAQVFLPGLAASRIRSRVERYGRVGGVHVSAWPAIELLWGHADSVRVRTGPLALNPRQAAALLWEGRGVARMDVAATAVRIGSLQLTDARLRKRGDALEAHATASEAAAQAALPPGMRVQLLGSGEGKVQVSASGGLFGIEASVPAVAEASEGKLIAHPVGPLLEGFRLKLFSDPHVFVEGLGARSLGSGYVLSLRARLR
jgi:hypothetical protein